MDKEVSLSHRAATAASVRPWPPLGADLTVELFMGTPRGRTVAQPLSSRGLPLFYSPALTGAGNNTRPDRDAATAEDGKFPLTPRSVFFVLGKPDLGDVGGPQMELSPHAGKGPSHAPLSSNL